jgi:hypothetical protein
MFEASGLAFMAVQMGMYSRIKGFSMDVSKAHVQTPNELSLIQFGSG